MAYIITDKSADSRPVYFDGFGFTLIRANAKKMDAATAVSVRSNMDAQFPNCKIAEA